MSGRTIQVCIWFDQEHIQDTIDFYTEILNHGGKKRLMVEQIHEWTHPSCKLADVTIDGVPFALMACKMDKEQGRLNDSVSLQLLVDDDQKEIDRLYEALSEGGEKQPCGWVIDKFGLRWQVSPKSLMKYFADPRAHEAVNKEMQTMKKIDVARIEKAAQEALHQG